MKEERFLSLFWVYSPFLSFSDYRNFSHTCKLLYFNLPPCKYQKKVHLLTTANGEFDEMDLRRWRENEEEEEDNREEGKMRKNERKRRNICQFQQEGISYWSCRRSLDLLLFQSHEKPHKPLPSLRDSLWEDLVTPLLQSFLYERSRLYRIEKTAEEEEEEGREVAVLSFLPLIEKHYLDPPFCLPSSSSFSLFSLCYVGEGKGWGLLSSSAISRGVSFLLYGGELIRSKERERRYQRKYDKQARQLNHPLLPPFPR